MKDHIETDEERRIRQYEAMSSEQKTLVFQKITTAFGTDMASDDPKKLANKATRASAKAKKLFTKLGHLAQGFRELGQLRDEATVLYLGLMQAGESPDPDSYWQYYAEITVLMNRLELLADEVRKQAEEPDEVPMLDSKVTRQAAPSSESPFPVSGYFDIEEAARYTGLSKSTLYHDNSVPCYKAGEKLVFVKHELDAWLKARPRKSAGNYQSPPTPIPLEEGTSEPKHMADLNLNNAYALSGFNEAISALAVMLVKKRWLDPESGPRLGEWLAKPKDFQGPPLNWLVGTKTLYSFVVCLCHANILVLDPGTKKKGAAAPQYEPAILRAFYIAGKELKEGFNRTVMKHEAAVKHFRTVLTSYAVELHGVDRRTDGFLDNIDLYYLYRKKKDFSHAEQQLEQGLPREEGKPPIGVFSVLDENVLVLLLNLITDYPALLEIEPSL